LNTDRQKIVVNDCPLTFLDELSFHGSYGSKVDQPRRGIGDLINALVNKRIKGT
jgi:hypothetical protein